MNAASTRDPDGDRFPVPIAPLFAALTLILILILILIPMIAPEAAGQDLQRSAPDGFRARAATAAAALARGEGAPLSLAAGDFDGDGVTDLAVGLAAAGQGWIRVYRGVPSAFGTPPGGGPTNGDDPAPFSSPVSEVGLPAAPRWLAAGDFDADGALDLVAAGAEQALHWLRGDGRGGLGRPSRISLAGSVTGLAAGEFNRRDGLIDLAVAVDGSAGAEVLVFQSLRGALLAPPERFGLPAAAVALVLGRFDGHPGRDLAVAAGRELILISGHDPHRRPAAGQRPGARAERLALPVAIASLAPGSAGSDGRRSLLVTTEAGVDFRLASDARDLAESWRGAEVVEPALTAALHPTALLRDDPAWRAALPLRLDGDARTDLVALREGMSGAVALTHAGPTPFVVTSTGDAGDATPGDGACDSGAGICTLRAAIDEANALAGTQHIHFSIAGPPLIAPSSGALIATGPVVLDATTQPGGGAVEIDGSTIIGAPECDLELSGGASVVRGFVFTGTGVCLKTLGGNLVEGNFFGTDPTVTTVLLGGTLRVTSGDNTIGGTTVAARNYFVESALLVGSLLGEDLAFDNRVIGNYFGVDATGTATLGGFATALLGGGSPLSGDNEFGGAGAGEGNVIAGAVSPLIATAVTVIGDGTTGTLVQGNRIGTNPAGTAAFPDLLGAGVVVDSASTTTIGGTSPAAANVIAGNTGGFAGVHGVVIHDVLATGNVVQGNFIGTDITGSIALGGYEDGVFVEHASATTIGGSAPGAGNVISGHDDDGIQLTGISGVTGGNVVQGNRIGTDASGTTAIPNGDDGISNLNMTATVIGGSGAGNVIAGNLGDGIEIFQSAAPVRDVEIRGNAIGTDAGASLDLGNGGYGVQILGAEESVVGGTGAGEANTIAYNGEDGIAVGNFGAFGDENRISGNSIFANAGLGIDLDFNGVTANDPGDGDSGSNEEQNFPVLTLVTGPTASVDGTLDSTASTTFSLEFFANSACDPTGHGEGERFLGSTAVATDPAGEASFSVTLTESVIAGELVTATATDPLGNTSELSACLAASLPAAIFSDGFESGDTTAWSAAVP